MAGRSGQSCTISLPHHILIDRVGKIRGAKVQQQAGKHTLPMPPTVDESQDETICSGSVRPQMPSFAMPGEPEQFCQLPQVAAGKRKPQGWIHSKRGISSGRGSWLPISPSGSMIAGTATYRQGQNIPKNPDGIFTRAQYLPLAVHVLGGPKQRSVEIDVTVSPMYSNE